MPVGLHLMTKQTQVPRISILLVVDPGVAGSVPTSISVFAELRQSGQGFAWGQ
ncbi:hypothetical protein MTR67_044814 [Solanum verrucosum]|uniref:Uncharacterized protein n=1 Tax=Solanum verrucosum TaxID=315347 RepID=A0AAF0UTC6_SOLVR|nr:hypothetical protein MTR67_044814 [Solanum verrucosum]